MGKRHCLPAPVTICQTIVVLAGLVWSGLHDDVIAEVGSRFVIRSAPEVMWLAGL